MQDKVYKWVERAIQSGKVDANGKTLDIGSFDVNGSLRPLFNDYTGLDMRMGPNVDIVASSHDLPYEDNTFDAVTCVEVLEHDDDPFQTMKEIHRVLKPGGWCILAASGINFPKHSYPSDYWRFTAEAMAVLLKNFNNVGTSEDNDEAYGAGRK